MIDATGKGNDCRRILSIVFSMILFMMLSVSCQDQEIRIFEYTVTAPESKVPYVSVMKVDHLTGDSG